MDTTKATAEFAEAEVASLLDRAAYHKRQVWKHRKQLNECMAEAERMRQAQAARIGLEVEVVPIAHSQEAESNARHTSP
jgi:hypothetical protein